MRYFVIGAAGHGQEVAWSLREQVRAEGRDCDLLFFDDAVSPGPLASGLGEVAGDLDAVSLYAGCKDARLVLGIGLPRTKLLVTKRLDHLDLPWETVVHPLATIGPNARIGEGTYVAAGAVLTVNVRVGRFATINFHCQVAHDDTLADFVTLHPDVHLAGNVAIGDGSELGTGAIAIPGVTIGSWAILGAGATAVNRLAGGRTYVGIPARPLAPTEGRSSRIFDDSRNVSL